MHAVGAADVAAVDLHTTVEQLVDALEGGHLPTQVRLQARGEGIGALFGLVHGGDDAEAILSLARQFLVAVQMSASHAAAADDGEIDGFASGFCHIVPRGRFRDRCDCRTP